MSIFAQLVDDKVVATFTCPQDPAYWPGVVEVDDDDPRYLQFQRGLNQESPVTATDRTLVEEARLRAYADPVTGSDRYFAEAARLTSQKDSAGAAEAKAKGLSRYAEIQQANPWPEEESDQQAQ